MAKTTPSMAKNKIKRCLVEIIDRPINKSQSNEIRAFFDNKCAYCDIDIDPHERTGHFDHLLSFTAGGKNDIHNIVLACNICNGDEKREMSWKTFLKVKTSGLDAKVYEQRLDKIIDWQSRSINPVIDPANIDPVKLQEIDVIINEAVTNFEESVEKMRKLRDSLK